MVAGLLQLMVRLWARLQYDVVMRLQCAVLLGLLAALQLE